MEWNASLSCTCCCYSVYYYDDRSLRVNAFIRSRISMKEKWRENVKRKRGTVNSEHNKDAENRIEFFCSVWFYYDEINYDGKRLGRRSGVSGIKYHESHFVGTELHGTIHFGNGTRIEKWRRKRTLLQNKANNFSTSGWSSVSLFSETPIADTYTSHFDNGLTTIIMKNNLEEI